ncbi:MAG: response regulator [Alphaproteobacteria bacterium]|nr:response regulator [Alphaproteobacteria bacterium]
MNRPDPIQLSPFRVKLSAILASVERVAESPECRASDEIKRDLDTIASATETLRTRVDRLAQGNPDGWSASKMRHDLRTPLNHIIGYGEILLQEAEDVGADTIVRDLSRIVRGGKEVLADLDELVRELVQPGSPPAPTPIGVPRARVPQPAAFVPRPTDHHGRILVVDDNSANRELLTRGLSKQGHTCETAADGAQALEKLESGEFDLVLLDLVMPRLDGIGVLTVMKQDPMLRRIPVIMISGHDDLPQVVKCIQLGADDYLSKPFDSVLLQARIGACLEKKALVDKQSEHLEQIELERKRANELLRVILPDPIVHELQQTDTVTPRLHHRVAVLFCDIVGFTAYSENRAPEEILANLQKLVEAYEGLMGLHKMQKIKTIGDSFMAAAGLLEAVENPVLQCVRCGRDMIRLSDELKTTWGVRVGVSYGPVVAGVLGRQQFQFDLWGDTVNTAARVEAHGRENAVCLSGPAWDALAGQPGVQAESLGSVKMKGKGLVPLFRVIRVDGESVGIG